GSLLREPVPPDLPWCAGRSRRARRRPAVRRRRRPGDDSPARRRAALDRADGNDAHPVVAPQRDAYHVAGPAPPELLVELFLPADRPAVAARDLLAFREPRCAR